MLICNGLEHELKQHELKKKNGNQARGCKSLSAKASCGMSRHGRVVRLQAKFLTIYWSAGLVNQAVPLDDAVGLFGLSPGHVDRGGGQLAEVDEARSTGRFFFLVKRREERGDERQHSATAAHTSTYS